MASHFQKLSYRLNEIIRQILNQIKHLHQGKPINRQTSN